MSEFASTDRVEAADPGAPEESCAAEPAQETTGPAAVDRLADDLAALKDQAALYLAARGDRVKLGVRRAAVGILIGLLGLLVGATILMTAAVLTVVGIARGLAEPLGRLWLGELVTGTAILAFCALAISLWVRNLTRTSRWKTINRYAELQKRQLDRRRSGAPKSGDGPVGT